MTPELSDQEKITNYETLTHIDVVRKLLSKVVIELIQRADAHDATWCVIGKRQPSGIKTATKMLVPI